METHRFYFLEPSKVGSQHITLIRGYLTALASSRSIGEKFELILCASKSTLATLPAVLRSRFQCRPIPVMNPEKRRLILKTLLELFVVVRCLLRLRAGDILFVTCVLPTTLWLLESVNRLLRRTGVHVVLHGELEGVFATSPQRFQALGYWSAKWFRSRRAHSRISLVVLDDFIRARLVQAHPDKLTPANVAVIHHPVFPMRANVAVDGRGPAICFIGYRTRFKRFDHFSRLADEHPSLTAVAIGGGKLENLRTGTVECLSDQDAYLRAISECSAAVFPCTSGYSSTLSASALDALSAGVPIVALDQPFFQSLASYFGPDMVTVRTSVEELSLELDSSALSRKPHDRASRLDRLARSKYDIPAVRRSFEELVFPTHGAPDPGPSHGHKNSW